MDNQQAIQGKPKISASAIATNKDKAFTTTIVVHDREYIADEPVIFGGNDEGASPSQYICMALASCKAITIRMYANRKQWILDEVNVKVNLVKGDQMASGLNTFFCAIKLAGDLTGEQQKRLMEISNSCPINRLLSKPSDMVCVIE